MVGMTLRVGVLVKGLGLASLLLACSSEPAEKPGGSGGSGGGGGGPSKIDPTKFIVLSGDSAQTSMTPAPAAYTTNCITCHANAGQGVTLLAPEIRHSPATLFGSVTRAGRPGSNMVPFPVDVLTDADSAAIQVWLAGLPKPTTGDQLYLDYCGNCHGADAMGSVVPLGVRGGIKSGTMQLVRMGHGTDPADRKTYMPAQSPDQLTDAELGLIADFLGAT